MTASGAGLCLLPVFMGDSNRDLVRLTEPLPELTNVEHIIVHRDLRREPAVRKAMDAIAEVFHQMGPQLRGVQLDKPVAAAE
jgi:DNA-binding transcriptional LysR family regulator